MAVKALERIEREGKEMEGETQQDATRTQAGKRMSIETGSRLSYGMKQQHGASWIRLRGAVSDKSDTRMSECDTLEARSTHALL